MLRTFLKRFGLWPTVALLTLASVLVSVLVTLMFNGGSVDSTGVRIAILVPCIVAPLFSPQQLRLIQQLERVHEELHRLSITDELTQTYNRRHFMQVAAQHLAQARQGKGLSILIFDLDDFKTVNDRYGHLIGDAVLARLGYRVVASTGRLQERPYLESLGATEILERSVLTAPARPLESERFAAAVDTVGGAVLAGVLPRIAYGGSVAACGNAGGARLETTVFPFILRGVSLLGVDSVMCPRERRLRAWERLAHDLPLNLLEASVRTVDLAAVPELAQQILAGQVRGRVVVDLNA